MTKHAYSAPTAAHARTPAAAVTDPLEELARGVVEGLLRLEEERARQHELAARVLPQLLDHHDVMLQARLARLHVHEVAHRVGDVIVHEHVLAVVLLQTHGGGLMMIKASVQVNLVVYIVRQNMVNFGKH